MAQIDYRSAVTSSAYSTAISGSSILNGFRCSHVCIGRAGELFVNLSDIPPPLLFPPGGYFKHLLLRETYVSTRARARSLCVFGVWQRARVCYSSADAGPDSSENSVNGGEEKKRHDESIFECDATKGPLVSCERSQSFSKGARYCYRSWFQRRQIQTDSICYAVGGCPRDALAAALTDGRKDAEGKASRCK